MEHVGTQIRNAKTKLTIIKWQHSSTTFFVAQKQGFLAPDLTGRHTVSHNDILKTIGYSLTAEEAHYNHSHIQFRSWSNWALDHSTGNKES